MNWLFIFISTVITVHAQENTTLLAAVATATPAVQYAVYDCQKTISDIFTNPAETLQLGTFKCPKAPTRTPTPFPPTATSVPPVVITATPAGGTTPTATPPHTTPPPGGPIPLTTPVVGGPVPPAGYLCIDDVDPDMCDDNSSHLVPIGRGGITGSCGTVIEQALKLVLALPQDDKIDGGAGVRDYLLSTVSNSCGSTGPYPKGEYVSTYLVIDAFNLAGFNSVVYDLKKDNPDHIDPVKLFTWWSTQPGTTGYTYVPYTPAVIQEWGSGTRDLTGCAAFFKTSSSYHIGIVNALELFTPGGNGVLSILQSGAKMYIDRFIVNGWSVSSGSTNQTTTNGLTGFGCYQ